MEGHRAKHNAQDNNSASVYVQIRMNQRAGITSFIRPTRSSVASVSKAFGGFGSRRNIVVVNVGSPCFSSAEALQQVGPRLGRDLAQRAQPHIWNVFCFALASLLVVQYDYCRIVPGVADRWYVVLEFGGRCF